MIVISTWTRNNIPVTGLTPSLKIINAGTDTLVRTITMTAFSTIPGSYKYDFSDYDTSIDYFMQADGGIDNVDFRYLYATGNNELSIANSILTADTTSIVPGEDTFGALIKFIAGIEGGKWEMKNNQMIFYGKDNHTELARFNLFNIAGVPSMQDITKRERV